MSESTRRIPLGRLAAEFVVIVVGVLVALGADAWMDERAELEAEAQFLAEVHADLGRDSTNLEVPQRRVATWNRSAADIVKMGEGTIPASDSLALVHLRGLMTFNLYQPVSSAYEGQRQGLTLVKDAQLRRQIVEYYEVQQPYMVQFGTLVMDAHSRLRSIVQRHTGFVLEEETETIWPRPTMRFTTSWSSLWAEPEFRGAVEYVGAIGGNWEARIPPVMVRIGELRAALAGQLGSQP